MGIWGFFFPFSLTPVDGQRWCMRRDLGRAAGKGVRSEGSGNRGWKLSHGFWASFKSCWVRSLAHFPLLFSCMKTIFTVSVGGEGREWERPTTLQRDEHLRNSLRVKTATPQSEGGAVVSSVDTQKQSRTCSTPSPAFLNKPLLQIHISFGFLVENASQLHRKAADSRSLTFFFFFFPSSSNEKNDGVISGLINLICQTRGQPPQQAGQPVHRWPGR